MERGQPVRICATSAGTPFARRGAQKAGAHERQTLSKRAQAAYAHPGFIVLEERESEGGHEKFFRLLSKVRKR